MSSLEKLHKGISLCYSEYDSTTISKILSCFKKMSVSLSLLWMNWNKALCVQAHTCAMENRFQYLWFGDSMWLTGTSPLLSSQLLLDAEWWVIRTLDGTPLFHIFSIYRWFQYFTHKALGVKPEKRELLGEALTVANIFLLFLDCLL